MSNLRPQRCAPSATSTNSTLMASLSLTPITSPVTAARTPNSRPTSRTSISRPLYRKKVLLAMTVNNAFGNAGEQVFKVRIMASVGEREHGNGIPRPPAFRHGDTRARRHRRSLILYLPHVRDKTVAAPRYRLYVPPAGAPLAQRLSEHKNILREVSLFDMRIGPDRPHQLVFTDDVSVVFDEGEEHLERLRHQRHWHPIARQHLLRLVQAEGAEFVAG